MRRRRDETGIRAEVRKAAGRLVLHQMRALKAELVE
jgi:hypothetical protein